MDQDLDVLGGTLSCRVLWSPELADMGDLGFIYFLFRCPRVGTSL